MLREISFEESMKISGVYIDVRSPIEYNEDSVPGSVNIPLFSNNERAEVGTIYKMAGRDNAVLRGAEIVGEKLAGLISKFQAYSGKPLFIMCARGGMRSGSLASLLDSLGFEVYKINEGYKGYRKWIRFKLDSAAIPRLFVIQGLTGSGKTEIIRRLPYSIDLEAMAGHRSSVFGAMGLEPKSQKSLESSLVRRIDELAGASHAAIEGESRKIGDLQTPARLYLLMQESPTILIKAGLERRVDIILSEYAPAFDQASTEATVNSISGKLGRHATAALLDKLKAGDLRGFAASLLERYYDPLYRHSLNRKTFIAEIENNDHDETAEKIHRVISCF
jgi:tRNA 2-selenouridine synthase